MPVNEAGLASHSSTEPGTLLEPAIVGAHPRSPYAGARGEPPPRGDAARAGGLGLGLSIIRGFVAAQGGDVMVGENPGGGSVFTVYLPYEPHGEVPSE